MITALFQFSYPILILIWLYYSFNNQSNNIFLIKAVSKSIPSTPYDNFLRTLTLTSEARFPASKRLERMNFMVFFTTTIASLGLILIPLLDLGISNKTLNNLNNNALTAFQIFLAVSVLVYSIIGSVADYRLRSNHFIECGNALKTTIDKLLLEKNQCEKLDQEIDISKYQIDYKSIISKTENHEDIDYIRSLNKYDIKQRTKTKIGLKKRFSAYFFYYLRTYGSFLCLISLEIAFILEMVGVSTIFSFFKSPQE